MGERRALLGLCGLLGLAPAACGRGERVEPVRLAIAPPPGTAWVEAPRVAPDGASVAFLAADSTGTARIWIQPLGMPARSGGPHPLPGSEGAKSPAIWAPDAASLAAVVDGRLMRWPVPQDERAPAGPTALCPAPAGVDGTWGANGVLLFGPVDGVLWAVADGGGPPTRASRLDPERSEAVHTGPVFLPGGKGAFLFAALGADGGFRSLRLARLGSTAAEPYPGGGRWIDVTPGSLVAARAGTLTAQPFDAGVPRFTGDPVPVAAGVAESAWREFSAAGTVLAFRDAKGIVVIGNWTRGRPG